MGKRAKRAAAFVPPPTDPVLIAMRRQRDAGGVGLDSSIERLERIEAARLAEAKAKAMALGLDMGQTDIGTAERELKDRAKMVTTLEADPKTGRTEMRTVAQRAAHAIDRMFEAGLLRSEKEQDGEAARRRHEAGTWLLNLWDKCGFDTATICAYGRATGRGEMSDEADEALTWNRRCWRDTMIEAGNSKLLRALVMEDNLQRWSAEDIRVALDALADHRGM